MQIMVWFQVVLVGLPGLRFYFRTKPEYGLQAERRSLQSRRARDWLGVLTTIHNRLHKGKCHAPA